ncbi:MAG: hypothetical protein ACJ8R9_27470 [Steroidobacteraceae bacterium]
MPPLDRDRALFLIVATVILAYANSFTGGFQFDDFNVIVREIGARSPYAWWASQPGIRPLLKLSYALNNASALGLPGFHAVNLLIHLGNALLVARLLFLLTPTWQETGRKQHWAAWLGALTFALHPVQTEAVTYISGRSTSLATFFALASIVLWLCAEERTEGRVLRYASVVAFAAALLCKEFTAVVPAALLLCAAVRSPPEASWLRPALRRTALHWLLVVFALLASLEVHRYRVLLETSLATRDVLSNLATQTQAIFYLAGQLVHLGRLNSDPVLPVVASVDAQVLAHGAVITALIALGMFAVGCRNVAGFAVLWFFLWLTPTNSVLPRLDVANDRELYVALVGPAFGFARLITRVRPDPLRRAAVFAFTLCLALATFDRNRIYADEVSFWRDAAQKSPDNARAFANLGYGLALACRIDDARKAFNVALLLNPEDWRTPINLRVLPDRAFHQCIHTFGAMAPKGDVSTASRF